MWCFFFLDQCLIDWIWLIMWFLKSRWSTWDRNVCLVFFSKLLTLRSSCLRLLDFLRVCRLLSSILVFELINVNTIGQCCEILHSLPKLCSLKYLCFSWDNWPRNSYCKRAQMFCERIQHFSGEHRCLARECKVFWGTPLFCEWMQMFLRGS